MVEATKHSKVNHCMDSFSQPFKSVYCLLSWEILPYRNDWLLAMIMGEVYLPVMFCPDTSLRSRSELMRKKNSTTQILLKGYLEKPMPKAHIATLIG